MSNQIWMDVAGRPRYQVSSDGQIRSKAMMKPLSAWVDRDGYKKVVLSSPGGGRETTTVHKLVAITFHADSFRPGLQVRHIDGDPGNCSESNLAWGTGKENANDRRLHGRHGFGDSSGMAKTTDAKVLNAFVRARTIGLMAAAEEIGIKQPALSMIKAGKSRAHLQPLLAEMGVI